MKYTKLDPKFRLLLLEHVIKSLSNSMCIKNQSTPLLIFLEAKDCSSLNSSKDIIGCLFKIIFSKAYLHLEANFCSSYFVGKRKLLLQLKS